MRPRAAIAAEPQCLPNSDNSFAAEAPPLAATASTRRRSSANRSTSSNGGDWLSTSWVANEVWVMGRSLNIQESFYAGTTANPLTTGGIIAWDRWHPESGSSIRFERFESHPVWFQGHSARSADQLTSHTIMQLFCSFPGDDFYDASARNSSSLLLVA